MSNKVSVAPMMDCTDRHDRFFLRLMSKNVLLYTEMVATKSAIHGDRKKILSYSPEERPLALQVGGSNKDELSELSVLSIVHIIFNKVVLPAPEEPVIATTSDFIISMFISSRTFFPWKDFEIPLADSKISILLQYKSFSLNF